MSLRRAAHKNPPSPLYLLAARHIPLCDENPAPATPFQSASSSPHRYRDAHKPFRIRSYTNCRGSTGINRNLLQKRSPNRKSPNSLLLFRLHPTSASPLESAPTSHSQLIENTAALSPLESTLTRFCAVTPLEATLTKKVGSRGSNRNLIKKDFNSLQCRCAWEKAACLRSAKKLPARNIWVSPSVRYGGASRRRLCSFWTAAWASVSVGSVGRRSCEQGAG